MVTVCRTDKNLPIKWRMQFVNGLLVTDVTLDVTLGSENSTNVCWYCFHFRIYTRPKSNNVTQL